MIGGALARPCVSYPELFPKGTIWDRFPYLLPNLFSAATVFFGVVVGFLFLEETHMAKKSQRDRGIEMGNRIIAFLSKLRGCRSLGKSAEKQSLLTKDSLSSGYKTGDTESFSDADEPLPAYRSREGSPRLRAQSITSDSDITQSEASAEVGEQKGKTFTKPVIMNIMSYGILAL